MEVFVKAAWSGFVVAAGVWLAIWTGWVEDFSAAKLVIQSGLSAALGFWWGRSS